MPKNVYLRCWRFEDVDGKVYVNCEVSTAKTYRRESVIFGGIKRKDLTVFAFCNHYLGGEYLTKAELQAVAAAYLAEELTEMEIDLRH